MKKNLNLFIYLLLRILVNLKVPEGFLVNGGHENNEIHMPTVISPCPLQFASLRREEVILKKTA